MTSKKIQLGYLLLRDHFGSIVADVASTLMTNGTSPMRLIVFKTKLGVKNVKKALKVLIQHQFVEYVKVERDIIEYKIDLNRVLSLLRYPKCIYIAKLLYSDEGEHIAEELLKQGQQPASVTIQNVVTRLAQALKEQSADQKQIRNLQKTVYDSFVKLVEARFVQRSKVTGEKEESKNNEKNEDEDEDAKLYEIPEIRLHLIKLGDEDKEIQEPVRKKARREKIEEKQTDEQIYWRINTERFDQYLRDLLIVDAVKKHFDDEKAGQIAHLILRLSETRTHPCASFTVPISNHEIIEHAMKDKICPKADLVESYLHCFNGDIQHNFISKTEDRGASAMYSVNILTSLQKIVDSCLASYVEEYLGAKCSRIFRLLLSRKHLQQKQIEDITMIPAKEAKRLTYILFDQGLIKALQIPKSADYAPSRTIFLFEVDREQVCRTLIQRCYLSIFNAITRRIHETESNKALLDRKSFIDAIIANLKTQEQTEEIESQIQELEDQFSTHEKQLIVKIGNSSNKLEQSELQVDETLFILQAWLNSHVQQKILDTPLRSK